MIIHNNNDIEWEALIICTVYYTEDQKSINISLWGKRKLADKFWRNVEDQYLNTKLI